MQSNLMNSSMRNGLILGILFSINFLMSTANNVFLGLLSYVVVGFIAYLIYRYTAKFRDKDCDGAITYSHALMYIILLFVFGSLISAIVKLIFFKFINPNFLPDMINKSMTVMEQILPSVPESTYEEVEKIMSPGYYTLISFWMNIILGFVVGLVVAAIVKKDKNPFDENNQLQK